jgi:arylsulfatase A-like enzyme
MADRPNVLFFFTDDQRFDTIRALGNEAIITPHMDDLVRRGTAFTHAHIPGGTCPAVCMPSRAMLHTGRTLFQIHESGQSIPPEHTTLGQAFRANGYRTFGVGKWHNGKESFNRSFADGDEIGFGGMTDHWNVQMYHYDPTGQYSTTLPMVEDPWSSNKLKHRPCDHIHVGRHSSEIIADAGIRFLEAQDGSKPFFLYLSFLAPHDPRTMPKEFLELYDPESIALPPNFCGGHPFDNGELHVRDEMLAGFPRTPEEIRRHIAEYYAMISHLDSQIGRVMAALERTGQRDNTIIILAGDNGLAVGQHGLMGKQSCYDHSLRVPLIFAGPGVPKGRTTPCFAYLLDIFPTLCELCHVAFPASVQGVSLVPAMTQQAPVRESLYFGYREFMRAVRRDDFKLIEYVVNGRHTVTQLFDLANDPWELNNLAQNPAYLSKVRELRGELLRLRDEWGDRETSWGQTFWAGYAGE